MHLSDLRCKSTTALRELAHERGAKGCDGLRRHELLVEILKDLGKAREEILASGVLEVLAEGFGFLRWPNGHFQPGSEDIYVSPSQIRRFDLRTGDTIEGVIRAPKDGERYFALLRVSTVNQLDPDQRPNRTFEELTAARPDTHLDLGSSSHPWLSLIDALAPIGLGQRCLVHAPAGGDGTALIAEIAAHVGATHSDIDVVVALLDARPEEADELSSSIDGEVVAATIAQPPARLVQVAEMSANRARRLVELGRNVLLVIDSLSSLYLAAKAAPAEGAPPWAATAVIKSVLASAYRCKEGGSLTLVALVGADQELSDTIAGLANCELTLVRAADGRVLLDPLASRTESVSGFLAEDACRALQAARSALAAAGAGATGRAAELAASGQDTAALRAALLG